MEKVRGRIAVSEDARRTLVTHMGGDAVLIPNGVRVSAFASHERLPGVDPSRPAIAVPRPHGRAAQGTGRPGRGAAGRARGGARTSRSSSPDPGDIDEQRELLPAEVLRQRDASWAASATRTRPVPCGRSTSTWRPTPAASPSASSSSRPWPPRRPSSPPTCRPSGGCSRTARPAGCSRTRTPPALSDALIELLADPDLRARYVRSSGRPRARVRLGPRRRRRHRRVRQRPHAGREGHRGPARPARGPARAGGRARHERMGGPRRSSS